MKREVLYLLCIIGEKSSSSRENSYFYHYSTCPADYNYGNQSKWPPPPLPDPCYSFTNDKLGQSFIDFDQWWCQMIPVYNKHTRIDDVYVYKFCPIWAGGFYKLIYRFKLWNACTCTVKIAQIGLTLLAFIDRCLVYRCGLQGRFDIHVHVDIIYLILAVHRYISQNTK